MKISIRKDNKEIAFALEENVKSVQVSVGNGRTLTVIQDLPPVDGEMAAAKFTRFPIEEWDWLEVKS